MRMGSREADYRFLDERSLVLEQKVGEMLTQMAEAAGYTFDFSMGTGEDFTFVFFVSKERKGKRVGSLRFLSDPKGGGHYELAAVTKPPAVEATRWVLIQPTVKPDGSYLFETSAGITHIFETVLSESDLTAGTKTPVWYVLGQMMSVVEPNYFKGSRDKGSN